MSTHKSLLHAVLLLLWCSTSLCFPQPCHGALPPPPGLPEDTLTKSPTMPSNAAPNQRGDDELKEGNTAHVSFTTPTCPQVPLCHHITPSSSSSRPISSHLCMRASGGRAMLRHGVTATKKIISTAVNALLSSASFFQEGGHRWFSKTAATSSSEETPKAMTQQVRKTSNDPDDAVHSQFILHSQKFILRNLHELLLEGHAPNPTGRQAILSFISRKLRRITLSFSATGGGDEIRPACTTNPSPQPPPGNPELPCSGSSKKKHEEEDEEEVLFLVGDNGVGKTHVARLISLAWSLHCAEMPTSSSSSSPPCEYGDALLWLSGTSFAGSSPESAAKWIEQQVCSHGRQFPFGIVLLDDVSAFPPEVLPFLAPLLGGSGEGEGGGGAGTFGSCADVPLEHLLVIMTSDFGTQQRGRRRRQHHDDEGHSEYDVVDSDEELMQLIPKEFKFASRDAIAVARSSSSCSEKRSEYDKDNSVDNTINMATEAMMSRRMTIVPFRSWSLEDAKTMISTYVQRTFGCSRVDFAHHQYQDLQFVPLMTDSAIDFVLRLVGSSLWAENGHAVTRVLRTSLDTVVLDAIEAEVAIDEQGTLGLVVDGVVGAPNSEEGGPQIAQRLSIRFVPL